MRRQSGRRRGESGRRGAAQRERRSGQGAICQRAQPQASIASPQERATAACGWHRTGRASGRGRRTERVAGSKRSCPDLPAWRKPRRWAAQGGLRAGPRGATASGSLGARCRRTASPDPPRREGGWLTQPPGHPRSGRLCCAASGPRVQLHPVGGQVRCPSPARRAGAGVPARLLTREGNKGGGSAGRVAASLAPLGRDSQR